MVKSGQINPKSSQMMVGIVRFKSGQIDPKSSQIMVIIVSKWYMTKNLAKLC